jgi:hypothetical protein
MVQRNEHPLVKIQNFAKCTHNSLDLAIIITYRINLELILIDQVILKVLLILILIK